MSMRMYFLVIVYMINANKRSIEDILTKSVKYVVPDNQRNFEWKKEQAEEFWDDVSSGPVFLGTVVFDVSMEKEIGVVDGQQRLTTIFILLAALRNQARKVESTGQAVAIQNVLSFTDITTGKTLEGKLETSPFIKSVFDKTITNGEWDGSSFAFKNQKREVNRIRPIYEFFKTKIQKYGSDDIAQILKNLYDSSVVQIDIQDTQEAFDIFERTNARGLELNAADLLKNYLFAKNASTSLSEDWDGIVSNAPGNILRMIKYFYISRFGLVQKRDLFRRLKKHGEQIGAQELLNEIKSFSRLYFLLQSGKADDIAEFGEEYGIEYFRKEYYAENINRAFDALNLFGVSQTYPLIIKALEVFIYDQDGRARENAARNFHKLILSLEKYHFINSAISQRPGNEVEKYYADKCKTEVNIGNFEEFVNDIIKELKNKLINKEEFIGRFKAINYENDFSLIYYIFDRLNNDGRGDRDAKIKIYNPEKKFLKKNFNIDHLVAQNSDEYDFTDDETGDFIHNIGNLLIISMQSNSKLQNAHISKKFELLKEKEVQNLPEVVNFVKNWEGKNWEGVEKVKENIEMRAAELAEKAYGSVWMMK